MDRSDIEASVEAHYARSDIAAKIISSLGLTAAEPGAVPVEALFPADQLHHGGIKLTEAMARAAGITKDLHVLDAGSGIGGSARFLAARFGYTVHGIDLSPDFVEAAQALDILTGLESQITHQAGSILDLPFEDATFDAIWCQNVTMNIADKPRLFAEAKRVLKPGGTYVLSHLGRGAGGPIDYPLPWAMTEDTSFITPRAEMMALMSDAGFTQALDHQQSRPPAKPRPAQSPQVTNAPAMGQDMQKRSDNFARAAAAGTLIPMLITATRS